MFKIDRELMINLMKEKIDEGYKAVKELPITNKDCVQAIVNIFELEKTINDLNAKNEYDKEMSEKEKKEIQDALAKNTPVEVEIGE